jgi:acetolactate synthase-1/3 small subunit
MSQHTLSVLVENKPSVLARVSLLLARRGFNIHSMAVGPTADEGLSRMTIVVDAPELEQVKKQLHKLINVVRITELDPDESLEREIMMIRVAATAGKRGEILEIGTIFKATAIDVGSTSIAFTVGGEPRKINDFIELVRPYGIVELVKSGRIAMARDLKSRKLQAIG